MDRICQCIKQSDGKQCTYKAKSGDFCGVHKNCKKRKPTSPPLSATALSPTKLRAKAKVRAKSPSPSPKPKPKPKPKSPSPKPKPKPKSPSPKSLLLSPKPKSPQQPVEVPPIIKLNARVKAKSKRTVEQPVKTKAKPAQVPEPASVPAPLDKQAQELQQKEAAAQIQRMEYEKELLTATNWDLIAGYTVNIPVSNLICANSRSDRKRLCTKLGAQISNSMIRVATERIFANPAQSVMELPINSLDAMGVGGQNVGKFGMGFYSIFYWLVGHPKRMLIISTQPDSDTRYELKLQMTGGVLMAAIRKSPSQSKGGTTISLVMVDDPIDKATVESMYDQLMRLVYITSGYMTIDYDGTSYKLTGDTSLAHVADIILSKDTFSVTDYAGGMSLAVIMNSLLIPSSSTKTIQTAMKNAAHPMKDVDRTGMTVTQYSRLQILVNDIVIVKVDLNWALDDNRDILIYMPPNARLPVGRDDIIFTAGSWEGDVFYDRVMTIVGKSIDEGTVIPILTLLNTYIAKSNQQDLYRIQNRIYATIEQSDVIFVPLDNKNLWTKLAEQYGIKVCYHPRPTMYITERKLIAALKEHTRIDFYGKYTIPVNGIGSYFSTSFSQLVFVDTDYMKQPDWINTMISSSLTILRPVKSLGAAEADDVTTMTKYIRDLYDATFGRLDVTVQFDSIRKPYHYYTLVFRDNNMDFLRHLAGKLSNIVFEFSYGAQKAAYATTKLDYVNPGTLYREHLGIVEMYKKLTPRGQALIKSIFFFIVDTWSLDTKGVYYLFVDFDVIFILHCDDIKFVDYIAEHYINIAEAFFSLFLAHQITTKKLNPGYLLREIRQRISPPELTKLIELTFCNFPVASQKFRDLTRAIVFACNLYDDLPTGHAPSIDISGAGVYSFTAKQLIAYVFNNVVSPKPGCTIFNKVIRVLS